MNTSIDYNPYLYFFMPMRTFTLMFPNVLTGHMLLHLHVSPGPSPPAVGGREPPPPVHPPHPAYSSSRNLPLQQHLAASTHRRRSLPQQPHSTAAASRGTGLLPPQPTPAAACGSRNLHLQQHPTASTHSSRGIQQRQFTAATAYTRSSSSL